MSFKFTLYKKGHDELLFSIVQTIEKFLPAVARIFFPLLGENACL